MKGYVEKMINNYQDMLERRKAISIQLASLEKSKVSLDELIEVMTFSHPEGERVQTSGTSDKVARIALKYREDNKRINAEAIDYWLKRYDQLNNEIVFLENAISSLSEECKDVMEALVIKGMTWDEASYVLCISIASIQRIRNKALNELVRIYQKREAEQARYILS